MPYRKKVKRVPSSRAALSSQLMKARKTLAEANGELARAISIARLTPGMDASDIRGLVETSHELKGIWRVWLSWQKRHRLDY